MLNDPNYEKPEADPAMVGQLLAAISSAVEQTCIPDVTTTADILSALFTTLDQVLKMAVKDATPEDAAHNAKEISRILMDFMVEYGTVVKH
jgi:hypothetical protein